MLTVSLIADDRGLANVFRVSVCADEKHIVRRKTKGSSFIVGQLCVVAICQRESW